MALTKMSRGELVEALQKATYQLVEHEQTLKDLRAQLSPSDTVARFEQAMRDCASAQTTVDTLKRQLVPRQRKPKTGVVNGATA